MHPCCNGSLQNGTKITAIFQMVTSSLIFLGGIWLLAYGGILTAVGLSPDTNNDMNETNDNNTTDVHFSGKDIIATAGILIMIMSVSIIIAGAVSAIAGILLLIAATKRNRTMCMVWFVIQVIFVIVLLIEVGYEIISGENARSIFSSFVALFLNSYFLWVVWAFMEELKEEKLSASPYANPKPRV